MLGSGQTVLAEDDGEVAAVMAEAAEREADLRTEVAAVRAEASAREAKLRADVASCEAGIAAERAKAEAEAAAAAASEARVVSAETQATVAWEAAKLAQSAVNYEQRKTRDSTAQACPHPLGLPPPLTYP